MGCTLKGHEGMGVFSTVLLVKKYCTYQKSRVSDPSVRVGHVESIVRSSPIAFHGRRQTLLHKQNPISKKNEGALDRNLHLYHVRYVDRRLVGKNFDGHSNTADKNS